MFCALSFDRAPLLPREATVERFASCERTHCFGNRTCGSAALTAPSSLPPLLLPLALVIAAMLTPLQAVSAEEAVPPRFPRPCSVAATRKAAPQGAHRGEQL